MTYSAYPKYIQWLEIMLNARSSSLCINDKSNYEGTKIDCLATQYDLKQVISKPMHLFEYSSSCTDLINTSQRNLKDHERNLIWKTMNKFNWGRVFFIVDINEIIFVCNETVMNIRRYASKKWKQYLLVWVNNNYFIKTFFPSRITQWNWPEYS